MIKPTDLKDEDIWSILVASREGNLEKVKELISRRPELVHCEYNYTPPIHFAVREGHLEVLHFLLEQGANPTYRSSPFDDSLLTMAKDRGYRKIEKLLTDILSHRYPIKDDINEFLKSARNGDLTQIKQDLKRNPELARVSNETSDTALHQAAAGGHPEILMELLNAGANPDAVRADGCRPIHCALDQSNKKSPQLTRELSSMLLTHGATYNIYLAALLGDIDYVREALKKDPTLANYEDSSHFRPISAAVKRNDIEMVKLLLEYGANPSLPEHGAPLGHALWIAVYHKRYEMAKLLLEHGANPNTAPESSGSVLLHAEKDPELKRLLLKYGADENSVDLDHFERLVSDNALEEVESLLDENPGLAQQPDLFWGEGILSVPANNGDAAMIELLMSFGARIPDVSKWGRYYYFKHYEIASLLLEKGMNPNHKNWQHTTLLHDMAHEGDIQKAQLLIDYGADINAVDEEYCSTPLGYAARFGKREIVKLLLKHGADPNKAGAPWATPLAWAEKKGHLHIVADLEKAGAR